MREGDNILLNAATNYSEEVRQMSNTYLQFSQNQQNVIKLIAIQEETHYRDSQIFLKRYTSSQKELQCYIYSHMSGLGILYSPVLKLNLSALFTKAGGSRSRGHRCPIYENSLIHSNNLISKYTVLKYLVHFTYCFFMFFFRPGRNDTTSTDVKSAQFIFSETSLPKKERKKINIDI